MCAKKANDQFFRTTKRKLNIKKNISVSIALNATVIYFQLSLFPDYRKKLITFQCIFMVVISVIHVSN